MIIFTPVRDIKNNLIIRGYLVRRIRDLYIPATKKINNHFSYSSANDARYFISKSLYSVQPDN